MKPLDFLVGVREFFSRFVPGAVFLYLFPPSADLVTATSNIDLLTLAIAAYLAGSVAAGAGGLLDWLTDEVLGRRLFRRVFASNLDDRETGAKALRDRLLAELEGPVAVAEESPKAFWRDFLRLNCPAAAVELDRIEAGQKMFRSLIAVFLALGLYGLLKSIEVADLSAAASIAILFLLALASVPFYIGGRLASLQAVYRLAIAYSANPPGKGRE